MARNPSCIVARAATSERILLRPLAGKKQQRVDDLGGRWVAASP
jgi:hypothetical protein